MFVYLRLFILLQFILVSFWLSAQNEKDIDSLLSLVEKKMFKQSADTNLYQLNQIIHLCDKKSYLPGKMEAIYLRGLSFAALSGEWKSAEKEWQNAYKLADSLQNKLKIIRISGNLGIVYEKLGDFKKSESFHLQALEGYSQLKDTSRIASTMNNLALLYISQSKYFSARQIQDDALKIVNNTRFERETGLTINNLGLTYFKKGNFGKAFDYYKQAELKYASVFRPLEMAEIQNNLGTVYFQYGDTVLSLAYYRKALEIAEQMQNSDLLSRVVQNIALVYQNTKNYKDAFLFYLESIRLSEKSGNVLVSAVTYNNLSRMYREKGDKNEAKKYMIKSLELKKKIGYLWGESYDYLCLAEWQLEENNTKEADSLLLLSIDIAQRIESTDLLYQNYFLSAKSYLKQHDTTTAVKYLINSLEQIETIRTGIGIEQNRKNFTEQVIPVYKLLIDIKIQQNRLDEALYFIEKMKLRNLLSLIMGGDMSWIQQLTPETKKEYENSYSNLIKLRSNMQSYCENDVTFRSATLRNAQIYKNAKQEYNDIFSEIVSSNPKIKDLAVIEPILSAQNSLVRSEDEGALVYVVLEDKISCLILKGQKNKEMRMVSIDLQITRNELLELTTGIVEDWMLHKQKLLYEKLMKPIEKELLGIKQLCVLPDGYLHSVPFHALQNPETGKYLLEDCSVYYVYSLTLLSSLRQKDNLGKKSVLALGNPTMQTNDTSSTRMVFESLPKSEEEVRSIVKLYKNNSKSLLNAQASETNFKKEAVNYGIVHMATHGIYDEVDPMYSSLMLSPDSLQDGILSAAEIIQLDLNADLVIMSACETAKGKVTEGEGIVGLSRAFFGATVPTVVGSMWQVDDNSTKILMEQFYKNLQTKKNYAESLRLAQLFLFKNTQYKDPFFWAPFTVIGDND